MVIPSARYTYTRCNGKEFSSTKLGSQPARLEKRSHREVVYGTTITLAPWDYIRKGPTMSKIEETMKPTIVDEYASILL